MIEPLAGQRQKGESNKAVQACNDYLRMGPGRSLRLLLLQYAITDQNLPPTKSNATLKEWSVRYRWQERAALHDASLEQAKNARAEEIMHSGLALAFERADKLKYLGEFLEQQMFEQGLGGAYHNIWLPDVKQIGSGEYAERVDIERFNSAIVEQYRGVLDDIAKETGGRVQKQDITSGGKPIAGDDDQHNRAVSTLAHALGEAIPGANGSKASAMDAAE